jgi:hypothetical protein
LLERRCLWCGGCLVGDAARVVDESGRTTVIISTQTVITLIKILI